MALRYEGQELREVIHRLITGPENVAQTMLRQLRSGRSISEVLKEVRGPVRERTCAAESPFDDFDINADIQPALALPNYAMWKSQHQYQQQLGRQRQHQQQQQQQQQESQQRQHERLQYLHQRAQPGHGVRQQHLRQGFGGSGGLPIHTHVSTSSLTRSWLESQPWFPEDAKTSVVPQTPTTTVTSEAAWSMYGTLHREDPFAFAANGLPLSFLPQSFEESLHNRTVSCVDGVSLGGVT